jgi:hypothetical protein
MFMPKAVPPPPADVSWSMNDGRVSAVGRCWLEYKSQNILTVGWSINYVSHHYPMAVGFQSPHSSTHVSCANRNGTFHLQTSWDPNSFMQA